MKENTKKKSSFSNLFFLFAFTAAFLAFSMGYSALNSQQEKLKKYDGETNKVILLTSNGVTGDDINRILNDKKITIQLRYGLNDKLNDNMWYEITTEIKSDSFTRVGDLRYGNYLSNEDYNGDKNIGVFSNRLTKSKNFTVRNDTLLVPVEIDITEKARTFDTEAYIDIPNKLFYKLTGSNYVDNGQIPIVISGDKSEIDSSINLLKSFVLEKNNEALVDIKNYTVQDIESESTLMFQSSFLILVITVVNSISIAYLWVQDNKKDLAIRKVCGAGNIELLKIFFGKLILIALVAVTTSLVIQFIIGQVFKGMFLNLDIRLSLSNIFISLIASVGVSLISSIPALVYINKVQPIEILKEG
ncbi:ABC transporter permease [Clostridium paraputrificum]|uniref:ABC transporter permease n=1 Tax=Clostridium TaxID=1485 RepID=UPI003D33EB09